MAYDTLQGHWNPSPLMDKLLAEKKSGREIQDRKHEDWNDTYELYRNKVRTNRLTQRQAVNIPLMKETIKTLLSRIDEAPEIEWKELSGDMQKELIYQEIWEQNARDNKLEIIDLLDKKNVLLYGYSVKKLNIKKDGVGIDVLDVFDTTFDPLMKPCDIESARFVINLNIFRSVREILADDRYTEKGKHELKIWADSPEGISQSSQAKEDFEEKMERLKAMGVDHSDFPLFAGGDRIVNLTEHFTRVWNKKQKKFERRVVVYADDKIELLDESLEDLLGVDFWPFVLWSEDPETNEIYPDSVADLVRTPNKVLNVWFSQLIENRTLKNFQMHWFDATQANYTPQTYEPGPGRMLPAPGDPSKTIKPVEISGLDDTMGAIQALVQIVERASGATAIEKGQAEEGQQTLGEIQILTSKAGERVTGMAKFYRNAWYELAWKWDKLMHSNAPSFLKLEKQARSGKIYPKRVYTKDWVSDIGYRPIVRSSSEQEEEGIKGLQKFDAVLQRFPNNQALVKIAQRRMLEILDLTPEELREIEETQEEMNEMMKQQAMMEQAQPQQPAPQQNQSALVNDIQNQLQELSQI